MVVGISGVGGFGMSAVGGFYQSRLSENIRSAKSAQQAQKGGQVLTARRSSSPETPVEPVRAVRPVTRDEASLPELTSRLENDPAAMAGRMRTRYGEINGEGLFVETGKESLSPVDGARKNALEGQLSQAENALTGGAPKLPGQEEESIPGLPGQKDGDGAPSQGAAESAQEAAEEGECQTCEKRKYQDGSDDMGVSFKTPTNVKPEQAASAVRGHEMEHVVREQAKAKREGREVVSQSVTMHTGICPECGRTYVSGGTTHTVTRAAPEKEDYAQQEREAQKPALMGKTQPQ